MGKKIAKDKSIKEIPIESFNANEIQYIDGLDPIIDDNNSKKSIIAYIALITCIIIISLLAASLVFGIVNNKIVQGNVIGNNGNILGFSIVSNDYDASSYITNDAIIYYDGDSTAFYCSKDAFSVAEIVSIGEGKVKIKSIPGNKEGYINNAQIDFVLYPAE